MLESMYKNTKINSIESLITEVEEKINSNKDLKNEQINDEFLKLATNNETAIYLFSYDGSEVLIVNKGDYYQEFIKDELFDEIIAKSASLRYGKFYITFENSVPAPNKTDYPSLTKDPIESIDSSIICAKFVTINIEEQAPVVTNEAPMRMKSAGASRSVAKEQSYQNFVSNLIGNNACSGHTECDAIIMDDARIAAVPSLEANHTDAALIHEAAIGKITGEQIVKLMTLGLSEEEAQKLIINGFLN